MLLDIEMNLPGFRRNPPLRGVSMMYNYNIIKCHLPQGSKIRWPEDMSGELTSVREPRVG